MELKPCPFCGGSAEWSLDDNGFYIIGCDDQNCYGWIYEAARNFGSLEIGAEMWNRRANDV